MPTVPPYPGFSVIDAGNPNVGYGFTMALLQNNQRARNMGFRYVMYTLGWDLSIQLEFDKVKLPVSRTEIETPLMNSYRAGDGRWFFLIGLEADRHFPGVARVIVLITLATLMWVPIGVWIGLRPKLAERVQPLAQFLAAFPANLAFPVFVVLIVRYSLNPNIWLSPLLILGTQWYILFNVIAGASAFPNDLRDAAKNFRVRAFLNFGDFVDGSDTKDALVLDMTRFNAMSLNEGAHVLTVQFFSEMPVRRSPTARSLSRFGA